MKFKFLEVFKRCFNWFKTFNKPMRNRPHFMSRNAWSYARLGKPTPAMQLYVMWSR